MTKPRKRLPVVFWCFVCLFWVPLSCARPERTSVSPRPVQISEVKQYAVIIHSGREEVLLLGTKPGAVKEAEILDLRAFPSEPVVTPVSGAPFQEVAKLMRANKGIEVLSPEFVRGGGARTVPIDMTESETVGVQMYRFKTDKVYFPLKSFHATGGEGSIELVLIAPGTLTGGATQILFNITDYFHSPYLELAGPPRTVFELSNSAAVLPRELRGVLFEAEEFFSGTKKLFIQALRYSGPYVFPDDLTLEISRLDPRRYVWDSPEESSPWGNEILLRPAAEEY